MASIRQNKVSELIRREIGIIFQQNARTLCKGAMVTPTVVRVSPDLSSARVYVSIFGGADNQEVLEEIKGAAGQIRYELGQKVKDQLRKTPELFFYLDDSLDYAENIDNLLAD